MPNKPAALAMSRSGANAGLHDRAYIPYGALIAIERRRARMKDVLQRALTTDQPITVPAAVVGEWWRGHTDLRDRILEAVDIEPLQSYFPSVRVLAI